MPSRIASSRYFRISRSSKAKYGPSLERYLTQLERGDPLADDVVRVFAQLPPGAGYRMLKQAADHGIESVTDAPPELRAFFREIDTVPDWVDWAKLDLGGAVFLRSGVLGVLSIALRSLPLSYSSPAGNKPLTQSGRLSERAMRRLGETGHYVYLSSLPGGLRRFSDGLKGTIKVRIMHAQIRALARRSGSWQQELWGAPVNQCYMAATVLLLSKGLLDGLDGFGIRTSLEERQALIHLWRYAGYLLGVDREFDCPDEQAAGRLLEMVFDLDAEPDSDACALVGALMGVSKKLGLGTNSRWPRIFYGISEGLIGASKARALRYPESRWRKLVPAVRPAISAVDWTFHRISGGDRALNELGRRGWRYIIDLTLNEGGSPQKEGARPFRDGPGGRRDAKAPPLDFFTVEIHRKDDPCSPHQTSS